jgi:hypothetical protein
MGMNLLSEETLREEVEDALLLAAGEVAPR